MKLLSLAIQGFKSFDELEVINFEGNAPGLYFMTGDNLVEPDLGANGAGKSTILDALVWLLFDMTSRRLKAKSIKNWNGSQKVKVTGVFISRNDKKIELTRTWNPNSLKWTVDDKDQTTVTQSELEQEIGLNFDTFLTSIIVPQFSTMFFDEKATAQAQMFTNILDLDEWLQYSDMAKKYLNQKSGWLHDVEQDVATTEGQIISCENMDFQKDIDEWESNQKIKIRDVLTAVPTQKEEIKKLEKDLQIEKANETPFLQQISEIKEDLAVCSEDLRMVGVDVKSAQEAIDTEHDQVIEISTEARQVKREIEKMESLTGTCTSCGQEIDEEHREKEIKQLTIDLNKLESLRETKKKSEDKAIEALSKLKDEKREIEEESNELHDELDAAQDQLESVKKKQKQYADTIEVLKRDIARSERDKQTLIDETNPFLSKKEKNDENLKMLRDNLESYENDSSRLRSQIAEYTFWVKHFKEVRLFLISEALTQLEIEVNNNLDKLGMHDWEIKFDVESAKSDGTLKKGFSIFIKSPNNSEPVPWEAWSGGETQRLRIAGITGLTNLILNRKGIEINCEFWDEPTNGINKKGVEDLISTLREHARENNRQVWLIDHRSLNHGAFEKVITVVKDEKGSYLDEEIVDA